jgi:hypothetical protein
MSIIATRNKSRQIVGPIIILWLLCQSMMLCAGLLNGTSSEAYVSDTTSFNVTNAHTSHKMADFAQSSLLSAIDIEGGENNGPDGECCGEQDSYIPNASYLFFISLFVAFIFFVNFRISKSKSKTSKYFDEPPPRFNYPRNHVVNCSFLN